jgi:5-methylthioadenosine/S-adenosylhomocysteine deaminase
VNAAAGVILVPDLVVALDDAGTIAPHAVAVASGRIAAVGPEDEVRRRHPGLPLRRYGGRLLMPGLVNAHLHPELHLLRGLVEGLDLHAWGDHRLLNRALARLNRPDGAAMQRAATRAALAETALAGATCVFTYGVSAGSEATCAAALAELGLRGAITIRDAAFPADPPGLPPESDDGSPGRPLRFYRLHAEEALFEPELRAAAAALGRGARIAMHAAETRTRVDMARARFGRSTLRLLAERRLLSPRTLLSHAVHVDDAEIDQIAAAGARVVASPAAEMKLGDGCAPFAAMVAAGVHVAVGTDAAVCNNASDMLLECRVLGLLQAHGSGPAALAPEQILRCATRGGAALVPEARFGAIAEGWLADLILVDTANPRAQPLVHAHGASNVYANLVYSLTGQDVTDVMAAGRWVVRDRELAGAGADTIRADLVAATAELIHDR